MSCEFSFAQVPLPQPINAMRPCNTMFDTASSYRGPDSTGTQRQIGCNFDLYPDPAGVVASGPSGGHGATARVAATPLLHSGRSQAPLETVLATPGGRIAPTLPFPHRRGPRRKISPRLDALPVHEPEAPTTADLGGGRVATAPTFYGLRHAHARELASENTPINVIQQQLGHSNISTTHVYLCKIAPRQVIETMQSREWWF